MRLLLKEHSPFTARLRNPAHCLPTTSSCIPHVTSLADPANIAPLTLYGSVLASAVLAVLRRDAAVMWGLALLVVPFLPASNVFFPVGAVVAERVRLFVQHSGGGSVCGGEALSLAFPPYWRASKTNRYEPMDRTAWTGRTVELFLTPVRI